MPSHIIVNKEAVGGNQLIIVSTPVLAAAMSITSLVSSMGFSPLLCCREKRIALKPYKL